MIVTRSVFLLFLFIASGCDLNLLNSGCRPINEKYSLCQNEDRTYIIMQSSEQPEAGGVLEGQVLKIGWNDQYIVASRYSTFRGDPDGWMLIDIRIQKVVGPVGESAAKPLLGSAPLKDAATAWADLR